MSILFLDQNENCREVSESPTGVRDGDVTLKGSHRIGDGPIFLKISAPLSLSKALRMNLISAGSISMDRTFKTMLRYLDTGEGIKKSGTVYKSELETWYAETMLFIKI
jgi:hypothetical protein